MPFTTFRLWLRTRIRASETPYSSFSTLNYATGTKFTDVLLQRGSYISELPMRSKRKPVQVAMHCRCGNPKILARGLCSTCYTLKRQDAEYFGGLREQVLQRDGYRCRGCGASGRRKRSI